jgi:hypothetical protein
VSDGTLTSWYTTTHWRATRAPLSSARHQVMSTSCAGPSILIVIIGKRSASECVMSWSVGKHAGNHVHRVYPAARAVGHGHPRWTKFPVCSTSLGHKETLSAAYFAWATFSLSVNGSKVNGGRPVTFGRGAQVERLGIKIDDTLVCCG